MTLFEANRALLTAFRSGDRTALTEVYWGYVEAVERLLRLGFSTAEYRVGGLNPSDIADAVQETFTRAFSPTARNAYDGLRPFRPYLLRIARNLLVDRARRKGRIEYGATVDVDAVDESVHSPEDAILSARLRTATRAFISGLDERSRRIVTLRFEEERAQEDVARELGITRRKVRTTESRLRRDLAAHLRDVGLGQEIADVKKDDPTGRAGSAARREG